MADPILDEIWRVREQLVKEHGGLAGYVEYVRKLDCSRRQAERRKKNRKSRKHPVKKSP